MTSPSKKVFTLVFLKKNSEILLGFKTRGLGQGLWNGFGGKLESDESILNCAHRELEEECNLIGNNLRHLGVVKYEIESANLVSIVHVFTSFHFKGLERPSEEMNPVRWYKFHDIPFNKMWPDAGFWYPLMLEEKYFYSHIIYREGLIRDSITKEYDTIDSVLKLL